MKPSKGLLGLFRKECDKKCDKYKVFAHQIPFVAIYRLKYDDCMKKCVESTVKEEKNASNLLLNKRKNASKLLLNKRKK